MDSSWAQQIQQPSSAMVAHSSSVSRKAVSRSSIDQSLGAQTPGSDAAITVTPSQLPPQQPTVNTEPHASHVEQQNQYTPQQQVQQQNGQDVQQIQEVQHSQQIPHQYQYISQQQNQQPQDLLHFHNVQPLQSVNQSQQHSQYVQQPQREQQFQEAQHSQPLTHNHNAQQLHVQQERMPTQPTAPSIHNQLAGSTGQGGGADNDPNSQYCSHCKKGIPANASVYTCLICTTAQINTIFCVWCFTADQAGNSHVHDKSYYVTDSDLYVQAQDTTVPTNVWSIRMNIAGRIWYTNHATGLRTHIKPTIAATSALPAGWVETKTVEGQTFYFDTNTGTSTWTKPIDSLPSGWKELRTPDLVPFYVQESLGLSTWDRPGDQPKSGTGPGVANNTRAVVNGVLSTKPGIGTTTRSGSMSFTEAADISAASLLSATKAASKFTSHGFKKMGELGKKTNLKSVGKVAGQAGKLVGE